MRDVISTVGKDVGEIIKCKR